ncbi:hypothetical protein C8Q70DRAFT_1050926 [Cubamyces menziesii]|uniref:DUF4050 domain-containing protein n=1 Tax=Trametes cubensis TaxID=1111947 RepID=A0AAD7TTV2_9APHY|nr:hypothetical protein C8Q70DRAFT_1050926 [Cubamyces menziesii]KAJ8482238.1 hypothetical protein ONZ51_g5493 [Trametes cubensis]
MQSAGPGRAESVDSSTCVASDSESPAAIVITAPSSPDETPKQGQIPLPSPLLLGGEPAERTLSDLTDVPAILQTLPRATASTANSSTLPIPTFEQRLAAAEMPHPGPELFYARRTLWCTPGPNPPARSEPTAPRVRLEALLADPGAVEDDSTWEAGLNRVWDGLIGGVRLKHRLPLALVIKILQAGWIHEGTWPRGAVVPDSDEEIDQPTALPQQL